MRERERYYLSDRVGERVRERKRESPTESWTQTRKKKNVALQD